VVDDKKAPDGHGRSASYQFAVDGFKPVVLCDFHLMTEGMPEVATLVPVEMIPLETALPPAAVADEWLTVSADQRMDPSQARWYSTLVMSPWNRAVGLPSAP
jgi:hypothetical protein